MLDTQQKIKQFKNIAVAIVRNEDGKILLIKPQNSETSDIIKWEFPSNVIIPGATYTETFASDVLEKTGCIVEATSLISSEKIFSIGHHYEYVECKIVCKDKTFKKRFNDNNGDFIWIHPEKIKSYFRKRINKDLGQFFGLN